MKKEIDKKEGSLTEEELQFSPQKMVGWFNPGQLVNTGIKALLSSVFGNYADKREIQASLALPEGHDYSSESDGVWFDYTADLGDGFNSTYSIARLLSKDTLDFKTSQGEYHTQRGRILIMGGDQVYPVASRDNYNNRLVGPYNIANPKNEDDTNPPHLYAIPGNHDWYDGLTHFMKLFCQQRALGNWRTQQHRSYFAVKLSQNVWIWGIDIQLNADIDKPQLDYFETIVKKMNVGDNVILCSAEPSWVYTDKPHDTSYHNLNFFEQQYIEKNKFNIVVSLAGDLHHYARYSIKNDAKEVHKITSGGGGAFLHPTHNLPDELYLREGTFNFKKSFPEKSTSKNLLWRNLFYPFVNWSFACFMGCFYLLLAWMLQTSTRHGGNSFLVKLSSVAPSLSKLKWFSIQVLNSLIASPTSVVLICIIIFGLFKFSDKESGNGGWAKVFGFLHGVAHVAVNFFMLWIFAYINFQIWGFEMKKLSGVLLMFFEMFFIGGGIGSLIMGLYLMLSNFILKNHDNEAFSALKCQDYKSFLRFHLEVNKLSIYPIGVNKVTRWKKTGNEYLGKDPIPELIEEPIVIKF